MNRDIKITPDNSALINNILFGIQNGCRERLLTYNDIEYSTEIAESMLESLLRKQHRQNVKALVTPEYDAFSPLYRGKPEHTQCLIHRGAKFWYASEFERAKASRAGSYRVSVDTASLESKKDHIYDYVTGKLYSDHVVI